MTARLRRALVPAAVLAAVAAIGCDDSDEAIEWIDAEPAPALAGIDVATGEPFEPRAGDVLLVAFGYTSCMEVCPITLQTYGAALRALGEQAARVRPVYVTVDPARDTPERFRAFLSSFDPRVAGVYLDEEALRRTLTAWGVTAQRKPPDVRRYVGTNIDPNTYYSVDHTSTLFLVDGGGMLRARASHRATPAELAAAAKKLLDGSKERP